MKKDGVVLYYHTEEFLLDFPIPKEDDKSLHVIVIGVKPFLVIFEYYIGDKKETELVYDDKVALENIGYLKPINRFGFEIKVSDHKVYFNGEEIMDFINKHKLEKIVEEKV